MLQKIQILLRFLRFFWNAQTSYQVHSPFAFRFAREVLDDRREYYSFSKIEQLRRTLLREQEKMQISDYGAGSKIEKGNERTVRQLVKYSASSPFFCQVMFKSLNLFQSKNLLEMGTSVGISTLYQAAGMAVDAKLVTLEGCPNIAAIAQRNFAQVSERAIDLRVGTFDKTLVPALQDLERLDYVFIDGNHREVPTLEYFETCLKYAHKDSIFVLDDIHWSKGMVAAWQQVKDHPQVTMTIDLFSCGFVFFRPQNKTRLHYQLVPARWKPWIMGFFRGR